MAQQFESNFNSNVESAIRLVTNADGSCSIFYKQYRDLDDKNILKVMLLVPVFIILFVMTLGLGFFAYMIYTYWRIKKPRFEKEIKVIPGQGIIVGDKKIAIQDIDSYGTQTLSNGSGMVASVYVTARGNQIHLTGYTEPATCEKVTRTVQDLL